MTKKESCELAEENREGVPGGGGLKRVSERLITLSNIPLGTSTIALAHSSSLIHVVIQSMVLIRS